MKPRRKQVQCDFNLYPLYEENGLKCYDKNDMSSLQIKNTRESDPRSYEVINKSQEISETPTGFEPMN